MNIDVPNPPSVENLSEISNVVPHGVVTNLQVPPERLYGANPENENSHPHNPLLERVRVPLYLAACLGLAACVTITPPSVPPVEVPSGNKLRFVVMGDSGHDSDTQQAVAAAVEQVCTLLSGCHFALLLGDNIYNSGASHISDPQFFTKFEVPYAALDFPFYLTLGNHDYGGGGAGFESWKGQVQVDYSDYSDKWNMPAHFYAFSATGGTATVDFFAIDTNSIFYSTAWWQKRWLRRALEQSTADWKIVYGHHTYISNGQHGNAGSYEGVTIHPLISGQPVKDFVDELVCGKADLYLAGHDHNQQWLEPVCGTQFIVSGNASTTRGLVGRGNMAKYENDQGGGFVVIEVEDSSTLRVRFYDDTPGDPAEPNHQATIP